MCSYLGLQVWYLMAWFDLIVVCCNSTVASHCHLHIPLAQWTACVLVLSVYTHVVILHRQLGTADLLLNPPHMLLHCLPVCVEFYAYNLRP